MSIVQKDLGGVFTDGCIGADGQEYLAIQRAGRIDIDRPDGSLVVSLGATPQPFFPRICPGRNSLDPWAVVWRTDTKFSLRTASGFHRDLVEPFHGNYSIAIAKRPLGFVVGYVRASSAGPERVRRAVGFDLVDLVPPVVDSAQGSSQGIHSIAANDVPLLIYIDVPNLPYPGRHWTDGRFTASEAGGPGNPGYLFLDGSTTQALRLPGEILEPRPVVRPDGSCLIVCRNRLLTVTAPFPVSPFPPGGGGDVPVPVPPPVPVPIPVPPPGPGEPPVNIPDQSAVVSRIRGQFSPWNYPASVIPCLTAIAQAIGQRAGLLDKPSGANVGGFSHDIICFPDGHIFDVFRDVEGEAGPQWSDAGMVDPGRYRAVSGSPSPPPPPPPPVPPSPLPPGSDATVAVLTRMAAAVEDMAAQLKAYLAE